MTSMSEQREHVSVEIFRAIIRQATEKKRVPEYVSVHIVNAREVLCELDDLRTQLAAAQSEASYLKGLYEDANGLRAAAEHRAETAERERDAARANDTATQSLMDDVKCANEILRTRAECLGAVVEAARAIKEAVNIQYLDGEPSRVGHADSSLFVALDREIRTLDDASAGDV